MTKQTKKKKQSFWSDGMSIDETRVSTLISLLYLFSAVGLYITIVSGDIPPNVVSVIIGLVTAIAGINIADKFISRNSDGTLKPYDTERVADDEPPI